MILDLKTIIVNLMNIEKSTHISVDRLQKLLNYLVDNLIDSEYKIIFDRDTESIEKVVTHNNDIFEYDNVGEMIFCYKAEQLANTTFTVDERVKKLIINFIG